MGLTREELLYLLDTDYEALSAEYSEEEIMIALSGSRPREEPLIEMLKKLQTGA